jgi:hypothetical protein
MLHTFKVREFLDLLRTPEVLGLGVLIVLADRQLRGVRVEQLAEALTVWLIAFQTTKTIKGRTRTTRSSAGEA